MIDVENTIMKYENTFTHDNHVYSLDKVRVLVRKEPVVDIDISELLWVLKYDKPSESRIAKAKFRHPLLIAKYRGKWTVVDGLHRLEKYRRQGYKKIPCKVVSPEFLNTARIMEKGIFRGRQRFKI